MPMPMPMQMLKMFKWPDFIKVNRKRSEKFT